MIEKDNNIFKKSIYIIFPLFFFVGVFTYKDYEKVDYIYAVFISEVDINGNDKYKIPSNFTKIDEFILDGIKVYEIFKKTN
jgi:hypothetical protein